MLTREQARQRMDDMHAAELAANDLGMWWLSFADGTKPKGFQFLGVVIVEAYGFTDAIQKSHDLGINPGGEVQGSRVDPMPDDFPAEKLNRLLSKADLAGFGVSSRKES